MSALGSLVVKLALEYAEYTQGLDKSSQEALKFAKNTQTSFDKAGNSAKEFLGNVAGNVAGAVVSVLGLNSAFSRITESINILNSLDDAAQKTGSSIEDLSRIEQVARNFGDAFNPIEQGITRLAKGLAEIDDPTSNAIRALDAIGVSARDSNGQLRTAADLYIDVAQSLQQYEDGAKKTAVVQALFGKNGAELLPMLNNLAQGVDHVTGVTQENAAQAALFNDQLALGKARVTGFFTSLSVELLPTLNNIAVAVNNSSSQFNVLEIASGAARAVLKGLAIAAYTVIDTFQGMGREIGARAAQLASWGKLDFAGARFIGQALDEDNARSRAEYDKFVDTILNGEQKIAQAVDLGGTKKAIDFQVKLPVAVNAATQSIEKQTKAFELEVVKLKQYESEAKRARDITDSVATKQERYNQTLEELERLKPYLSVEAYTRALDRAQRELQDVGTVNRQVTTEMDQLWIQAGRNIQSIFSNSIFDFFNDGVDGMWRNAKSAVGRILSEFAALKMSQSIGLSAMFAVPGAASASGNIGGTGASMFDIASLGTNAMSLFKTGFGTTSLLSNVGSMLPGSAGSFFSGMGVTGTQAAAQAGASALWGSSGASAAASMGTSFAAVAGPAIAIAAVDQITRLLAGDKMLGGAAGKILNYVPVIGPLINGLFGRGPLKQKSTSLTGTIGAEGFENGFLQTDFVAKGGLFRSDKNDFARVDAVTGAVSTDNKKLNDFADQLAKTSKDVIGLISDTTVQVSGSLRQIGKDLGLSVNGIDSFSHSMQLVSEKGEMLADEQIAVEIARITDGLARGVLPEVDNFAKRGETAIQTVSRLGMEFAALTESARNLGASSDFARELVGNMSIEARTTFLELAGGAENLANLTASFSRNFLNDAERLAPIQQDLKTQLTDLGFAADLTNDQYKALVQTVNLSDETRIKLLSLGDALFTVNSAADAAANAIKQNAEVALNGAFVDLQNSVNAEREKVTDQYNKSLEEVNSRIQNVTDSIGKLKTLSDALEATIRTLRPIDRDEAKLQVLSAINQARKGIFPEAAELQEALGVLSQGNTAGFSSGFEFAREQAKTANLVGQLGDLTDSQLTIEERSLKQLQDQQRTLQDGFQNEMERLDSLIEQAQLEINSINGLNTSILSLTDAIKNFNLASSQGGGGVIGGGEVSGNPNISNQAIIDYFKVPRTPQEIARDAAANGVTSQQIINTGRFTQADADKFFRDNPDIPRFANGGYHRGGLRIVGERGPELERTGPSHITSNNDLKKSIGNDDVVAEVKLLRGEMNKLNKTFDAITQNGTAIRTKNVA